MPKLTIIEPAVVLEHTESKKSARGEAHIVTLARGTPITLDGVSPVIAVQVGDAERDATRLLRAAEQLLPVYRHAPGVAILDAQGQVQGVISRARLEESVLQMRRGEYPALAKGLGLRADYRPPAGDVMAPFVYWQCPQCQHIYVPAAGHEDDPPDQCRRHDPPVQMERHIYGGQ